MCKTCGSLGSSLLLKQQGISSKCCQLKDSTVHRWLSLESKTSMETLSILELHLVSHHPEELESTKIILPFVGMANVFPLKLPSQCCVAPSDLPTYRLQFRTLAFTPELPPSGCFSAATSRACPVSSLHLHLAFHRFDRGNLQETRLSPCRASTHRFHRWDPPPRTATNVSCRQI